MSKDTILVSNKIFYRTASGWGLDKVFAANPESVSVSGDVAILSNYGWAKIYERNSGGSDNWGLVWSSGAGVSSAVSGNTAIVGNSPAGSYGMGEAYIYERNNGSKER